MIVAGRGRLAAARQLGLDEVPVMRIAYLSDPRKRALMLAENRIVLNAGWEIQILAAELAELSSMELDLDIDPTGFEMGEIDVIFDGARGRKDDVPEVAPLPVPDLPRITLRGDIWRLGPHGIMCGDALSTDDLDSLMQDDVAAAGFVDPPYNVRVNGHVSGKGQFRRREFVQGSGELSKEAFGSFLSVAFSNGARVSRDGAVWFACMDWRHIDEMLGAGRRAFGEMLNLCVWGKINGGMGSFYRSQHELVFVFRTGRAGHRNSVQLGRFGRNRTNLWACSGVNVFRPGRTEDLHAHPTARPVAMVRDALMDVSARGDIVLDTFLGAGATFMAAHDCGRLARGLELDPLYVDVALRRWRGATGEEPAHRDDAAAIA
ncbi:MAG: DNA methylase N-4 [Rhodobacteraceae bacterium]|nr:DNA methylase N-4 [Paracoccaceae bacterium]